MTKIDDRIKRFRLRQELENWQRLANRVLPLHAFYGRKDEQEAERNLFYDRCAKVFGWKGWEEMTTDTDFDTIVVARSAQLDTLPEGISHGGRGREVAAIQRDRTVAINLKSAPFEWLSSKGYLESREDAAGIGNIRFSAGMKFRDLLVGAEPMTLKTANIEGKSGSGGVPVTINDFKIDCINELARLRRAMFYRQGWKRIRMKSGYTKTVDASYADRPILFVLLERLVYADVWIFDGLKGREQRAMIQQIQMALDQVAIHFGLITQREYAARWHTEREASARPGSRERAR